MMHFGRASVAIAALAAVLAAPAAAQDLSLPEPVGMDGNPAARLVLDGNAAFVHGDLQRAAADYHAALARIPSFAIAMFNLGLVEIHEGNRGAGLADMDRGIALAGAHRMSARDIARLRSLRAAFAQQPMT